MHRASWLVVLLATVACATDRATESSGDTSMVGLVENQVTVQTRLAAADDVSLANVGDVLDSFVFLLDPGKTVSGVLSVPGGPELSAGVGINGVTHVSWNSRIDVPARGVTLCNAQQPQRCTMRDWPNQSTNAVSVSVIFRYLANRNWRDARIKVAEKTVDPATGKLAMIKLTPVGDSLNDLSGDYLVLSVR